MKLTVIGSRGLSLDITPYVPKGVTEITSGGAIGIDTCAEKYADDNRLSKHIIRPDYIAYPGKVAPLIRNDKIVELCDEMLAFWDTKSTGTLSTINKAKKLGKKVTVIEIKVGKTDRKSVV